MANELRFVDGNLLFVGGSLAMNADCCCDAPDEVTANCNGRTFTFPSFFVVDFGTVGSYDDSTPPACDVCDFIGGVWELPYETLLGCGVVTPGYCRLSYTANANPPCGLSILRYVLTFELPCSGTGDILVSAVIEGASVAYTTTIPFTTNLMSYGGTVGSGVSVNCDTYPGAVSVF